jgi:hypothetical protein
MCPFLKAAFISGNLSASMDDDEFPVRSDAAATNASCLKDIKLRTETKGGGEQRNTNFTILLVEEYIRSSKESMAKVNKALKNSRLNVMSENVIEMTKANLDTFISGRDSDFEVGVEKIVGTKCGILLIR